MPNVDLETKYLASIINVAKAKALENQDNLAFDPQGSVMVDITRAEIEVKLSTEYDFTADDWKAFLAKKTEITSVSLDITSIEVLNSKFLIQATTDTAIQEQLKGLPKGSINPIYRELYFHMNATKRVYAKVFKQPESDFEAAFQATLKLVSTRVMDEYQNAIATAKKPLSKKQIRSINQHLDKVRITILAEAHSKFLELARVRFNKKQRKGLKHLAEETTATPNDIVYVGSHQVTWAAGNDASSHDRQFGTNFGHQETVTHNYDGRNVTANKNQRFHLRVASFAVKSGHKMRLKQDYIDDVKIKLTQLKETENILAVCNSFHQQASHPVPPRAIIYNLYTAINKRASILGAIDEKSNKQSESAKFILKGAHAYNRTQLEKDGVFCLVQNISVNGYGIPLGYNHLNALLTEATLMTEMAVLHTLYDPSTAPTQFNAIFEQYRLFLRQLPQSDTFFSQSAYGVAAINLLNAVKTQGQATTAQNATFTGDDVVSDAKKSLFNLMINNRHFRNDATLFQALSVFTEKASMAGCKSAIDRTPMINNRVAMLERALNEPDSQVSEIKGLREALQMLAKATSVTIIKAEKTLKTALNAAVNYLGVQTQASMQTNAEIGGAAKYSARSGIVRYFGKWLTCWNTNAAEHSSMSTVAQEGRNTTQIHNTLAEYITTAQKNADKDGFKQQRQEFQPVGNKDKAANRIQKQDGPTPGQTLKAYTKTKLVNFPEQAEQLKKQLERYVPHWHPTISRSTEHDGYVITNKDSSDKLECYSNGKVTATSVPQDATDAQMEEKAKKIVALYRAVNSQLGPVNLRCPNDDRMHVVLQHELQKHGFNLPPSQLKKIDQSVSKVIATVSTGMPHTSRRPQF